ncbi:hypothetical protein ACFV8E_17700 [Streptomyces sp. NPDC059849]|uniref:hypothetical protein n=1 Tax=Streptomyces sp. NPDC059849 TaxID=3346969 RepID=UPI00365DD368
MLSATSGIASSRYPPADRRLAGHARQGDTSASPRSIRSTYPGFTPDLLKNQVRTNMGYLTHATCTRRNFEHRSFNLPNTCRVIATDKAAYLTFYSSSAHGRNSPCLYARAPGLLYTIALQQFDTAWMNSSPAHPAPQP